jgi:hypothetical protein
MRRAVFVQRPNALSKPALAAIESIDEIHEHWCDSRFSDSIGRQGRREDAKGESRTPMEGLIQSQKNRLHKTFDGVTCTDLVESIRAGRWNNAIIT